MRIDHAFHGLAGDAHPTPETIERYMARARRMRSEVVHEYLHRAREAVARLVRRAPAARTPAAQGC